MAGSSADGIFRFIRFRVCAHYMIGQSGGKFELHFQEIIWRSIYKNFLRPTPLEKCRNPHICGRLLYEYIILPVIDPVIDEDYMYMYTHFMLLRRIFFYTKW
jgi:hypothetical protein